MLTIPILPKIRNLIRKKTRYKIAKGGRGSGKSFGIATVFILRGLVEPGIKILCTRETQNSLADSTLAIMKRVIKMFGLDMYFETTKYGLRTVYGTEYIFRGLQHPDRIRSLEGIKYCWVAEAHRITEDAWEVLIPTIRDAGSEVWIDYNPDQEDDPVVTRFAERPDVAIEHLNWTDNKYFKDTALYEEMLWDREHDPDRYAWIWEGQFRKISEALVFRGKYHVVDFRARQHADWYYGADWGFSSDPTVLVRCYIHERCLYIDREAWGLHVELDDLPELFDKVPGSRKWQILADDSRPETISKVRKAGFKIAGAKKGKGSIEDGVEYLRSFDRIVINPRCVHTIDEFKTYSYVRDRLTGEPTPRLQDKNNHVIDALRYALSRARKGSTRVALSTHI